MRKIEVCLSKTLKLKNVLIRKFNVSDLGNIQIELEIEKMENYIKACGNMQIGPLIQFSGASINENDEVDLMMSLLMQSNQEMKFVEEPYESEILLRVPNCIYCRYVGPQENLNFAYDKLQVVAFEEEIKLTGNSYTVFVDRNEADDVIIADVFMERA